MKYEISLSVVEFARTSNVMLVSNEVAQEKNSDRGKEFNSVVWDVDELLCPISWL